MTNKLYDVFMLTASTVDHIIKMDGTFPILGGCSRIIKDDYYEAGGEGNLLICFSRLGGKILPFGPLGNDFLGTFLKKVFIDEGIDVSGLKTVKTYKTPTVECLVDDNGVHSFVSALGHCKFAEEKEIFDALDKCKAVCIWGYSLAYPEHSFYQLTLSLVKHAVDHGLKVYYDPGPLVGKISAEVTEFVLKNSDIISMNDEEAFLMTGLKDVEEAAWKAAEVCKGVVVVKAGAKGCFVIDKNKQGKWYPGFKVKTVDTSGAGDSFMSALMYADLNNWDLDTSITFANAAGAVKASKFGTGRDVPTFDEMVKFLTENNYNVSECSIISKRFCDLDLRG